MGQLYYLFFKNHVVASQISNSNNNILVRLHALVSKIFFPSPPKHDSIFDLLFVDEVDQFKPPRMKEGQEGLQRYNLHFEWDFFL